MLSLYDSLFSVLLFIFCNKTGKNANEIDGQQHTGNIGPDKAFYFEDDAYKKSVEFLYINHMSAAHSYISHTCLKTHALTRADILKIIRE